MDRALLRGLPLALALGLCACPLYTPTFVDCSVRCGDKDACPTGTTCLEGFCRLPNTDTRCDCTPGDERPCGGGRGECRAGVQRCNNSGAWAATCFGEGTPKEEICDGKDNDCDGLLDNDVTDALACGSPVGVCGAARQQCVDGGFQACGTIDYGPKYEPVEVSCDGLDNDCDGNTDSMPETLLVQGMEREYVFLGYDGGYAVVYSRVGGPDGGEDVVVSRFDDRFTPLGTRKAGSAVRPYLAAANVGAEVYVAWTSGQEVSVARMPETSLALPFAPTTATAAYSGTALSMGASGQTILVGFLAEAGTMARVLRWNLDGGFAGARDLNREGATVYTTDMYEVNVAVGAGYVAMRAEERNDGGSLVNIYRTYNAANWQVVNTRYPGSYGKLVPLGTALTSTYSYSYYFNFFPYFVRDESAIFFIPDVLTNSSEATLAQTANHLAYGKSDAVAYQGSVAVVYMDNLAGQLVLASSYRAGASTMFRQRYMGTDAGFGLPKLATTGSGLLGLAWSIGGEVKARRVCAP